MYASTRAQPRVQRPRPLLWVRYWHYEIDSIALVDPRQLKAWARHYPTLYITCSPFLQEIPQ